MKDSSIPDPGIKKRDPGLQSLAEGYCRRGLYLPHEVRGVTPGNILESTCKIVDSGSFLVSHFTVYR